MCTNKKIIFSTFFLFLFSFLFFPTNKLFANTGLITFGPEWEFTDEEMDQSWKDEDHRNQKTLELCSAIERNCSAKKTNPACTLTYSSKTIEVLDELSKTKVKKTIQWIPCFVNYKIKESDGAPFDKDIKLTVGVDPGTIEVQATPMTLIEYNYMKTTIQSDLFDIAKANDLMARNGSNGHIHIGIKHAFANGAATPGNENAKLFKRFFVDLVNHTPFFDSRFKDLYNAPHISNCRRIYERHDYRDGQAVKSAFTSIIDEDIDRVSIEDFARNISENIYSKFHAHSEYQQYIDDGLVEDHNVTKYVAINLNHILPDKRKHPEYEQTLELRGFRGQQNMDEFVKLITILQKRIEYIQNNEISLDESFPCFDYKKPQESLDNIYNYITETGLNWDDYKALFSENDYFDGLTPTPLQKSSSVVLESVTSQDVSSPCSLVSSVSKSLIATQPEPSISSLLLTTTKLSADNKELSSNKEFSSNKQKLSKKEKRKLKKEKKKEKKKLLEKEQAQNKKESGSLL